MKLAFVVLSLAAVAGALGSGTACGTLLAISPDDAAGEGGATTGDAQAPGDAAEDSTSASGKLEVELVARRSASSPPTRATGTTADAAVAFAIRAIGTATPRRLSVAVDVTGTRARVALPAAVMARSNRAAEAAAPLPSAVRRRR